MPSRPSPEPGPGTVPVILRIGEVFLKGKNRGVFVHRLVRNTRRALADLDGILVQPMHLRPLVWHPPAMRRQVLQRLDRVFGIQSLSPATIVAPDEDAIAEAALEQARGFPAGARFKLESRRRDKSFPIPSTELSTRIGARIVEATGLPVDVRNPERTIYIEIDRTRTFVFSESIAGPGGLPVGSSANLALLLSGGIDSPVAGWSAMRRGCNLSSIYFHSFPYTGDKTKEKVLHLAGLLARFQGRMAVHVVHFTEVQKRLRAHRRDDLAILLYRRMMMRVASRIADSEGAKGLVTGESLGQVASQTVENLGVIEAASQLPVLRPLIAFDKYEIIERARRIGTFDTSIQPYEDSCSLFVPKHPATRARLRDLERAESELDIEAMAAELVAGTERIVLS